MAVYRAKHDTENPYICISNSAVGLRSGLSLKARGLLCLLLSLPEGWECSIDGLAAVLPEGREMVRACVLELERGGFLVRSPRRRDALGKLGAASWDVYEKPTEGKPTEGKPTEGKPTEGKPTEGKPTEGKPTEGGPTSGNRPQQSKDKQSKEGFAANGEFSFGGAGFGASDDGGASVVGGRVAQWVDCLKCGRAVPISKSVDVGGGVHVCRACWSRDFARDAGGARSRDWERRAKAR